MFPLRPILGFSSLLLLIGAGALYWMTASSTQLLSANHARAAALRAELSVLSREQAELETRLSGLQQQVTQERSGLRSLENELAMAHAQANPTLEALIPIAMQQIEAGILAGTEAPVSSPIQRIDSRSLAGSLAARDQDERRRRVEVETSHGGFLDELGIVDPRRDQILDAVASAGVERNIIGGMQDEERIDAAEAERRLAEFRDDAVLKGLLTDAEQQRMPELALDIVESAHRYSAEMQLITIHSLPLATANQIAGVYARHFTDVQESTTPAERLPRQIEAIDAIRNELSGTLGESDMNQLNLFLEGQRALYENLAERSR